MPRSNLLAALLFRQRTLTEPAFFSSRRRVKQVAHEHESHELGTSAIFLPISRAGMRGYTFYNSVCSHSAALIIRSSAGIFRCLAGGDVARSRLHEQTR